MRIGFRSLLCGLMCLTGMIPVNADEIAADNMNGGFVSAFGWAMYVGETYPTYGYENVAAGQTFICSASGALTTIEASVDRFSGGSPLIVSVHTNNNGLPGAVLASISVPPEQVGTYLPTPLNVFDFSATGLELTAGNSYIVTFRVDLAGAIRYRARLNANNVNSFGIRALESYNGGASWHNYSQSVELGVRVWVASPPPPPPPPVEVAIDVQPGSTANFVDLKTKKPQTLTVDVFGADDFDVATVLVDTIALGDPDGPDGSAVLPIDLLAGDFNNDGLEDLRLSFDVNEMKSTGAISTSSTLLRFDAILSNQGIAFGSDSVTSSKPTGGGGKGNGGGKPN